MTPTDIRKEILKQVNHLSDQQLNQVLQFINQANQPQQNPNIDPLADFIGKVDHGNLAQNIDHKLYNRD